LKLVVLGDDGVPVGEIEDLELYDLTTTRGRAMLIDELLVALGNADRRTVLEFIRSSRATDASEGTGTGEPD
jgi:hypothetical protein